MKSDDKVMKKVMKSNDSTLLAARVENVIDDKKRGLVAQVELNGISEDKIAKVLGGFTRPWEPMPNA